MKKWIGMKNNIVFLEFRQGVNLTLSVFITINK